MQIFAGITWAPTKWCSKFHGVWSKCKGSWSSLWLCWCNIIFAETNWFTTNPVGTRTSWGSAHESAAIHFFFQSSRSHGHGSWPGHHGRVPVVLLAFTWPPWESPCGHHGRVPVVMLVFTWHAFPLLLYIYLLIIRGA